MVRQSAARAAVALVVRPATVCAAAVTNTRLAALKPARRAPAAAGYARR